MVKRNSGDVIAPLSSNGGDSLPNNPHSDSILNPHFNMHNHYETHQIMDNVAQQFIQSNGMSGFFLPKEFGDVDRLFGEELETSFNKAYQFAFYLESYTGFGGMGSMIGYGGLSVNDEMKIAINPSLFQHQCDGRMPEEGDWVYIKQDNSLFEIRYVDPYDKFYQFGKQFKLNVIMSKVTYNQEELQPELQNEFEFNLHDYDEDDLRPLFNLNGRLDTHIKEFETTEYIQDRSDNIINKDTPVTGTGHNLKRGENRVEIESLDDINKLLGGKQ